METSVQNDTSYGNKIKLKRLTKEKLIRDYLIEDVAKKIKEILLSRAPFKNADIQDEIKKFDIRQILLENFPEISKNKLITLQEGFREKVTFIIKEDPRFKKQLVENFSESEWIKAFKEKWPDCEDFLKEIFKNKGFVGIKLYGKGLVFIMTGFGIRSSSKIKTPVILTLQKVYGERDYEKIYDELKESIWTSKSKEGKKSTRIDPEKRKIIEGIYEKRHTLPQAPNNLESAHKLKGFPRYARIIHEKIKEDPNMSGISEELVLYVIISFANKRKKNSW